MHWLGASRREVENGQAPMTERDANFLITPNIAGIGTTATHRSSHGADGGPQGRSFGATSNDKPCYAAHCCLKVIFHTGAG
jgi:hypothetical protein